MSRHLAPRELTLPLYIDERRNGLHPMCWTNDHLCYTLTGYPSNTSTHSTCTTSTGFYGTFLQSAHSFLTKGKNISQVPCFLQNLLELEEDVVYLRHSVPNVNRPLNVAARMFYFISQPISLVASCDNYGSAEVVECLAEVELHSGFINCDKHPDHRDFIPIHQFSEGHLPPGSRHLVQPIKALGNIVALVAVKQFSTGRPETFPGTNIPYPHTALFGTCWVYKVIRIKGRCQCEECQKSSKPSTNFAYIIMHTAAHVVFDNSEAKHTTCYLFFDEGDTLASCKGVVQLSGMSRVWSDPEKDVSKMLYVTHDQDVIDCVGNAVHEWESARKSLECRKFIDDAMLTNGSTSADAGHGKLAIAVSHPHGCSKQVSIGECISVDSKGNGQTVYNYTTPTCRGSSGCYVFVEGRVRNSWDDNAHHGLDILSNGNGFVHKSN